MNELTRLRYIHSRQIGPNWRLIAANLSLHLLIAAGPLRFCPPPWSIGLLRFPDLVLAWLEARVTARMECGDNWILYAQVSHGGLLDPAGSTAVHQRRSGANY